MFHDHDACFDHYYTSEYFLGDGFLGEYHYDNGYCHDDDCDDEDYDEEGEVVWADEGMDWDMYDFENVG